MRHKVFGKKLNKGNAERRALLRNIAKGVFLHGRVETTEARAKASKPFVEKIITKAKKGDLAARRRVLSMLGNDTKVTDFVFSEIGKEYKDRSGGYTRIIRTRERLNDNAQMVILELVGMEESDVFKKEVKVKKVKGEKKSEGKEQKKDKKIKEKNVKKRN